MSEREQQNSSAEDLMQEAEALQRLCDDHGWTKLVSLLQNVLDELKEFADVQNHEQGQN